MLLQIIIVKFITLRGVGETVFMLLSNVLDTKEEGVGTFFFGGGDLGTKTRFSVYYKVYMNINSSFKCIYRIAAQGLGDRFCYSVMNLHQGGCGRGYPRYGLFFYFILVLSTSFLCIIIIVKFS